MIRCSAQRGHAPRSKTQKRASTPTDNHPDKLKQTRSQTQNRIKYNNTTSSNTTTPHQPTHHLDLHKMTPPPSEFHPHQQTKTPTFATLPEPQFTDTFTPPEHY
ncbi:hypothetical protein M758_1G218000 [Ceratodon purpureus]|uniref:Uncharacterized protein n=1 Tax=Ceratodon purpureus TaxID=3225 RepID=A0A8T0JAC3_CERPU|nr:hypothetical protein KC19_1G201900 [Ceratodon purpureus]KAG0630978.1 hypothetical protein M758_1G218000 [Ceratodon purpureus]